MLPQNEGKKLSDLEIDERAAEAETLLSHPLMGEAMGSIQADYLQLLMQSNAGSPEAMTAQVGLQIIDKFRAHLKSVINDKKMSEKYRRREKTNG